MNVNTDMSLKWPNITQKLDPLPKQKNPKDKKDKYKDYFSEEPRQWRLRISKLINDIVRISVLEEELEYYKTLLPNP